MDWRSLADEVGIARSRVDALKRRREPELARAALVEALAELDTAFEELAVAQEALREQAHQAVAASRALSDHDWAYRQLLSQASTGFLTTTADGLIIEANPRIGALFQVKPQALARKPLASFVPIQERPTFRQRLLEITLNGGRGPHAWQQRFRPRGAIAATGAAQAAAPIALDVSVIQVHAISGRVLLWRIMESAVHDPDTEGHWPPDRVQARIDQQVAERTHDLEERDRRKDEFLATLSHEMRTPLNVISGYASLLRAGVLKGEANAKAIAAIERNATMQAQLVADLLDVSRIAAGRLSVSMQPVDFCAVVEYVVESTVPLLTLKEIRLDYRRCSSARVLGDERRLQQVVSNLLSNAIKFTPAGGTVGVSLALPGTTVALTLSDTGIGIRPEFRDRLFQRFTQDESSITGAYGGLGLGLSIVRHLVDLHHGTVRAQSDGPGRGSSFIVELPLLDE